MSAADIKAVLEARSDGEAVRLALSGNQGVQVGLGKFHSRWASCASRLRNCPIRPRQVRKDARLRACPSMSGPRVAVQNFTKILLPLSLGVFSRKMLIFGRKLRVF